MNIFPAQTDPGIERCFAVMAQLRPHLVAPKFVRQVRGLQGHGFHLAALEDDGTVHAVAGYRFQEKLFAGRNL